jgi:hypothetical protein
MPSPREGWRSLLWYAELCTRVALLSILLIGIISIVYVGNIKFDSCAIEAFTDAHKEVIKQLNDIMKWILSLSAGLIGLFGSLALGLKEAPTLIPAAWKLLAAAILCFSFSVYFCLTWSIDAAQSLYIGCPELLASPMIQSRFSAAIYYLLAGLLCLATVVFGKILVMGSTKR